MSSAVADQALKNFKCFERKVDVRAFLEEIDALGATAWSLHVSRQNTIDYHRHTESIYLRKLITDKSISVRGRQVWNSRNWPAAEQMPRLMSFLRDFAIEREADLTQVSLVRLKAGSEVGRHRDSEPFYEFRDRYHLVLKSESGSILNCGDEEIWMREGELWWFDNKKDHHARNESSGWRIHVIFDLLPWSVADQQRPECPEQIYPRGRARAVLEKLIWERVLVWGRTTHIVQSNGTASPDSWLFDFRCILMDPVALNLISDLFWDQYAQYAPLQIAALEVGSLTLLGALLQKASALGIAANGVFVRKSRKKTGRQRLIEGELNDDPIVVIDDLVNSGSSFTKVALALEGVARKPAHFFSLLNFQTEEGREIFLQHRVTATSVFALSDFDLVMTPKSASRQKFEKVFISQPSPLHLAQYVIPNSSPAVTDSLVFFGTGESAFHAVDSRTGETRWTYQAEKKHKGILSSPALAGGKVFFGAYDGRLYALDQATGNPAWINHACGSIGSSPAISEELGLVFIGLEYPTPGEKGELAAFRLESGEKVWGQKIREFIHGSPAFARGRKVVAVGTNESTLLMCDAASGSVLWTFNTEGPVKDRAVFTENEQTVIFGSFDGYLYGLDVESGKARWKFKAASIIYSTPVIWKDRVFFGSADQSIYVVDHVRGEKVGHLITGGRVFGSPILADGHVCIGNNDGTVFEIDPSNFDVTRKYQIPDRVNSRIAYSESSGFFYAHMSDDRLFAFRKRQD